DGVTDLVMSFKWRFERGRSGSWAVFAGEKFPVGRFDVRNSAGELVEPSATAGSGSYDTLAGLAYSIHLTEQWSFDASAQYTLRTEHQDFKVGDRLDAGVAVAYRIVEDINEYPQASVFGEVIARHLWKSVDDGERDPNTGGTVLFVAPGVRYSPMKDVTFTLSPQIPVFQGLNGEQLRTDFRLVFGVTLSF
ncbi:MAG TPA: transporter, partial [Planctomycetota bacterium]|nr:transporter [Planctomycetota bacterium]